jgi:hypothetical protein
MDCAPLPRNLISGSQVCVVQAGDVSAWQAFDQRLEKVQSLAVPRTLRHPHPGCRPGQFQRYLTAPFVHGSIGELTGARPNRREWSILGCVRGEQRHFADLTQPP